MAKVMDPHPEQEAQYQTAHSTEDVVDLGALARGLWHHKWSLPLFLLLTLGLAALYLHTATYNYTATQQVTAVEQAHSSIPSGISSLGSMVGVDIGNPGGTAFALFPEALTSEASATALSRNDDLLRAMFPADWDPVAGTWREPKSAISAIAEGVKAVFGVPDRPWQPPGPAAVREHLQEQLMISPDRKKDIITISYEHPDPAIAKAMVEAAARAADDFLRAKSLSRADDYVAHLEGKIRQTDVAEYRFLLAQALIGHENTRMMANAESSFAAEPFGPAIVSRKPTSPKPVIVLAGALGLGLMLWVAYALLLAPLLARRQDAGEGTDFMG